MKLHTYLFFTNDARAAMTRYQEIFGGQLDVMSYSDLPPGESPPMEVPGDLVMHAALMFGDGGLLMASDDPTGDGTGVKGAAVSVTLADESDAHRVFDALADGGVVNMPLGATFWSPLFGMCVDRFGVPWMVGLDSEDQ